MSDIVNRALAELLTGQHETNQTMKRMAEDAAGIRYVVGDMGQAVRSMGRAIEAMGRTVETMDHKLGGMQMSIEDLNASSEKQIMLTHNLVDALKEQAGNSVPLRQKVAELETRLTEVERKVS